MGETKGRAEIFASIPDSYSGTRHFALTNALALSLLVPAIALLRSPSLEELAFVPLFFLVANAGEWALHKYILHRRVRGFGLLYERHALTHHTAFHHDTMSAPSRREWRWVLFPAPAFFGLAALVVPIGALLWIAVARNVGLLWIVVGVGFFWLYEWCHLSYHLPDDGTIGRLWLVRVLRRHHQSHHHPALAKKWNFNVTFPITDLLAGTIAREERAATTSPESA